MRTSNLDKVLAQVTGADCQEAADELGRYLDAGLTATRELLAAFLNDLNDECLARWGPHGDSGQAAGLPEPPVVSDRDAGMRGPVSGPSPVEGVRDADGDR